MGLVRRPGEWDCPAVVASVWVGFGGRCGSGSCRMWVPLCLLQAPPFPSLKQQQRLDLTLPDLPLSHAVIS